MEFIEELFSGSGGLLEVREISNKGNSKSLFFNSESIRSYIPPKDKNVYFGVFDRKNSNNGKASNCLNTKALWCDIDNFEEGIGLVGKIKEANKRMEKASIPEASLMVSSGNGLHLYWLLSERATEGVVGLNKAIAEVLQGDMKATDKARILRLPGTNNVKDINNIKRCEVVKAKYGLEYDIKEFSELLRDNIPEEAKRPTKANRSLTSTLLDSIKPDMYCIGKMLKGVDEGERNFALGRITKWLQLRGYTKVKAKKIIIEWNKLNDLPEEEYKLVSDFYNYWKGEYKLLGCAIDNPKLQQVLYKYCNRPECDFNMAIGNIKLENAIQYNNRLLSELYKLSGNDLIIYGLLVRHKEGLSTSLLIEKLTSRALGKPCISKPTRIKSIDTLVKKGFVEVAEGIQRRGIENIYKAIPQGTYSLGYTLLSNGAINGAIDKRVSSGQLKLYVLLLKYAYNKGACYPSLNTLAKELRTTTSYISKELKELEEADYIKRYYKVTEGIEGLDIRLLV